MSAVAEPLRFARARTLRVILPSAGQEEISLSPPNLDQLSRCLELDPKNDERESLPDRLRRLRRQAHILMPGFEHLTGTLTVEQVGQVVTGLFLAGQGIDPTDFVAVQQYRLAQLEYQHTAEEVWGIIDDMVIELAAELRIKTTEADKMPLADAVSQTKRLRQIALTQAKFDAALHGKPLS